MMKPAPDQEDPWLVVGAISNQEGEEQDGSVLFIGSKEECIEYFNEQLDSDIHPFIYLAKVSQSAERYYDTTEFTEEDENVPSVA